MEFKGDKYADVVVRLVSRKRDATALNNEQSQETLQVITHFAAHRHILASFSPKFDAQLTALSTTGALLRTQASSSGPSQSKSQGPNNDRQARPPNKQSQQTQQPHSHAQADEQPNPRKQRTQVSTDLQPAQLLQTSDTQTEGNPSQSGQRPASGQDAVRTCHNAAELSDKPLTGMMTRSKTRSKDASESQAPATAALPTLVIMTTQEEALVIECMIEYMYRAQQEAAGRPPGAAYALLDSLTQPQLVQMLHTCSKYEVKKCADAAASALAGKTLLMSTVSDIYALPDVLADCGSLRPAAKHRLMEEFGDLEVVWASEAKREAFCNLPLKAVLDILSDPGTKAISEDTAAVAACMWIQSQAARHRQAQPSLASPSKAVVPNQSPAPTRIECDALFSALRLEWLTDAFLDAIPDLPAFQRLLSYMQHPARCRQLQYLQRYKHCNEPQVMNEALQNSLFKDYPFRGRRPMSSTQRIRLKQSVPASSIQHQFDEVCNTGRCCFFATRQKYYGGFVWMAELGMSKDGLEVYLTLKVADKLVCDGTEQAALETIHTAGRAGQPATAAPERLGATLAAAAAAAALESAHGSSTTTEDTAAQTDEGPVTAAASAQQNAAGLADTIAVVGNTAGREAAVSSDEEGGLAGQQAPLNTLVAVKSLLFSVGKHDSLPMRVDWFGLEVGRNCCIRICNVDEWQRYVVNEQLYFEVWIEGPPLL